MSCKPTGFTTLDSTSLSKTVGRELISTVDTVRDLLTELGLRAYNVKVIRTRWSGGIRGSGYEYIKHEMLIKPTPRITDLTSLTQIVNPIGMDEDGGIEVSEISGRFSEEQLRGVSNDGEPVEPNEQVFYEIEFISPDPNVRGIKRRFFLGSAPMYSPSKFQWTLRLQRAHQDRDRDGELR